MGAVYLGRTPTGTRFRKQDPQRYKSRLEIGAETGRDRRTVPFESNGEPGVKRVDVLPSCYQG